LADQADPIDTSTAGSTYIPVDNWIYPALDRLHALGYVDTAYLGLKPWTRLSIAHMLESSADNIDLDAGNDEARAIYATVLREVDPDRHRETQLLHPHVAADSAYVIARGIQGLALRDSFHLGQTVINDYGRPYENGFNDYAGFSMRADAGRFALYFRGEQQLAPSGIGYSQALAGYLSNTIDLIPYDSKVKQDTLPAGPIAAVNIVKALEANLSYHLGGHEVSFGRNDHWMGPAQGASMFWGNNAENIWAFEVNRVEPLYIKGLSRLTGRFRYDFFVGPMQGHTFPNAPWVHVEKINFKPTRDLEFGFSRMAIWGGKDHAPITLYTFFHSFFSFQNVTPEEKLSRDDPGARFGTFDFAYRVPYLRRWLTLYTDSVTHDSVSPISNPPRSGWRPGLYLARFPHMESMDLRVEGATTDTSVWTVQTGQYTYWEYIQRQGPTNNGSLVGDWVGRQGKGGQAWLTYHLSPREEVQVQYRYAKAATGFLPGGTTQNDFAFMIRKRVKKDFEIQAWIQHERWKAPLYQAGLQSNTAASFQVSWFPRDSK
jgi:hypothetical protein